MKLLILFTFILSFNSFAKCMVVPIKDQFKDIPYFVEGVVFDSNFINGKVLKSISLNNQVQYPVFKIRVLKFLKGESSFKELTIKKYGLSFGTKRFPKPLVGIRNGKRMVFSIKKIKTNGEATVLTSACSHRFTVKEVKSFL